MCAKDDHETPRGRSMYGNQLSFPAHKVATLLVFLHPDLEAPNPTGICLPPPGQATPVGFPSDTVYPRRSGNTNSLHPESPSQNDPSRLVQESFRSQGQFRSVTGKEDPLGCKKPNLSEQFSNHLAPDTLAAGICSPFKSQTCSPSYAGLPRRSPTLLHRHLSPKQEPGLNISLLHSNQQQEGF